MKKPSIGLVNDFMTWFRNDPHSTNEDFYEGKVSAEALAALGRDEFIEFFFQFARDGGLVQSGGHRTAPRFRAAIEAKYDQFRAFVLEPFGSSFNETAWLERIETFTGFGQGLATIYLNRVDKKRYAIVNNKAVEAVELLGVDVPVALGQRYEAVRNAWRQLIEWFPEFDNFYRTDALSQFLIGEKQGLKWAEELRGNAAANRRFWIYAPGEQARLWEEFREKGLMGIGWDAVGEDLSKYSTEVEVRAAYAKAYGDNAKAVDGNMVCDFVRTVREGDGVFVKKGTKVIVGYGEVASPYFYDGGRKEYRHLRKAVWSKVGEWELPEGVKNLPVKTLTEVKDPERVEGLLKVVGGVGSIKKVAGAGFFSSKTFDLLAKLHEQPVLTFYEEHSDEFKAVVEGPLQALMQGVAERLPPQMLEVLETEKRLFSRIAKNDYGKGGTWDFYWGAFYPKGGKRTADPQLFIWINREVLGFGFYVGEYGPDPRKRFVKNCTENAAVLKRLVAVGTALASGPPHRSVREELPHTALTSGSCDGQPFLGTQLVVRATNPVTRIPGSVSGTSALVVRSPWSPSFPLRTPLQNAYAPALFARFVGTTRPSDSPQTCLSTLRLWPSSTVPPHHRVWASAGPPGSRAWSFHTCLGSLTPRCRRTARAYRCPSCCLPHIKTRSAHRSGDFGAPYLACVYPCQRFAHILTNPGA